MLAIQKRKYRRLQIGKISAQPADHQPLRRDRQSGGAENGGASKSDDAQVELGHVVDRGICPVEAGDDDPETEQAESRVEGELQRAGAVIFEIAWDAQRQPLRTRQSRSGIDRAREAEAPTCAASFSTVGFMVDVAHGEVAEGGLSADIGAETRHQQRMRAEVLEEVVGDGDTLDVEPPRRALPRASPRPECAAAR